MSDTTLRALIVDDEKLVRELSVRALEREGFVCEEASDGAVAMARLAQASFDVVVTDLRMPNKHGHALATEILAGEDHPIVVVVTGVVEPRLAKDLITRGVEAVEFKPVEYLVFGAKLKAICMRERQRKEQTSKVNSRNASGAAAPETNVADPADSDCDSSDLNRRMANLPKLLPVSQAALDVYNLVNSEAAEIPDIAEAIGTDPSLSVDVIRLANSTFYNAGGKNIVNLEDAVVRLGQKRVGEMALATGALAAVTANVIPWMNADLIWRRSIAAGMAVELMVDHGNHKHLQEGLFLSALLHCSGRIALATIYPQQYERLIKKCSQSKMSLADLEVDEFPLGHGQVAARLLESWNIPPVVYQPLSFSNETYETIHKLQEPMRTKAALVKLAVLIGRVAVGQWEDWDRVELPPRRIVNKLDIDSISHVIHGTQNEIGKLANMPIQASTHRADESASEPASAADNITYSNVLPRTYDFLAELIRSTGCKLNHWEAERINSTDPAVVNCTETPIEKVASHINMRDGTRNVVLIGDATDAQELGQFGTVLSLPCSYAALRSACHKLAQDPAVAAAAT